MNIAKAVHREEGDRIRGRFGGEAACHGLNGVDNSDPYVLGGFWSARFRTTLWLR